MKAVKRGTIWGRSIFIGILAAIAYGVVHDQISVRICPEYLTEWHPKIIASEDPTVVALAWGVVATWWFGLILGAVLALAATAGKRPFAPWLWIKRAIVGIFVTAAIAALVGWSIFHFAGAELRHEFFGPIFVDRDHIWWRAFSSVAAMHEASYDAAGVSTLIAAIVIFHKRSRLPVSAAA